MNLRGIPTAIMGKIIDIQVIIKEVNISKSRLKLIGTSKNQGSLRTEVALGLTNLSLNSNLIASKFFQREQKKPRALWRDIHAPRIDRAILVLKNINPKDSVFIKKFQAVLSEVS